LHDKAEKQRAMKLSSLKRRHSVVKSEYKAPQILHLSYFPGFSYPADTSRYEVCRKAVQTFIASSLFDLISGVAIIVSAILLGVETQWECYNLDGGLPSSLVWSSRILAVYFILELVVRFWAWGFIQFWKGPDAFWNIVDTGVVSLSVVEILVDAVVQDATATGGNLTAIRLVRVIRLCRVVRIIRVMRSFRALRVLVLSISNTLRSLFWTMGLMFLIIYCFAV
ncbi:unnamed protein product, partial [Polarella glacialis]